MDRELADKIWAYRQRQQKAARARLEIQKKLEQSGVFALKQEIEFLKDALRELSEKIKRRVKKC